MPARLGMKRDVARPGLRKIRNDAIDRLDHQVHINRRFNAVVAQCLANQRPNRQIWYEMIVHDVEVNDFGPGIEDSLNVIAQSSEIGGKYGRSNHWCHGKFLEYLSQMFLIIESTGEL